MFIRFNIYKYIRGVTRHLSHKMRHKTSSRDEMSFLDFRLKNTKCKKIVFEMNLYFMKLNFYFNELNAVITPCKLELHDSG